METLMESKFQVWETHEDPSIHDQDELFFLTVNLFKHTKTEKRTSDF